MTITLRPVALEFAVVRIQDGPRILETGLLDKRARAKLAHTLRGAAGKLEDWKPHRSTSSLTF